MREFAGFAVFSHICANWNNRLILYTLSLDCENTGSFCKQTTHFAVYCVAKLKLATKKVNVTVLMNQLELHVGRLRSRW